jgi:hypothetical protein
LLADYDVFRSLVENTYGLQPAREQALAQTQLDHLKQSGDLLEFLTEFEGLCATVGIRADSSKVMIVIPKLEPYYQSAIRSSGELYGVYTELRAALGNLYARKAPSGSSGGGKPSKRSKCGKCGKRHSGECRAKN